MKLQFIRFWVGGLVFALIILSATNSTFARPESQESVPTPFVEASSESQGFESPKQLKPLKDIRTIEAGAYHACALTRRGGVLCWGYNASGQLGDGSTETRYTPAGVTGLEEGAIAIEAGVKHTCALNAAGGVQCWGDNYFGQLGNGTTEDSALPVQVAGLDSGYVALAAGDWHTCALSNNGGVKCWGDNNYNRLGNGSEEDSPTPVDVVGLVAEIKDITAGEGHTCALSAAGGVQCWGTTGFLGVQSFDNGPLSVTGLESGVSMIEAGAFHTCAVQANKVYCWGYNPDGQLGSGEVADISYTPVQVSGVPGEVTGLAAGFHHTCAWRGNSFQCWGNNQFGQLGDGATASRSMPGESIRLNNEEITAMTAGYYFTCALTGRGLVKCWGLDREGFLGNGSRDEDQYKSQPVAVPGLESGVTTLDAGENLTCAAASAGGVQCWGATNTFFIDLDEIWGTAIPVGGIAEPVIELAVGSYHACALTQAGSVRCWGSNSDGQLGDGVTEYHSNEPVVPAGLEAGVKAIAAGDHHTCALTQDGGLLCWGKNEDGQLGDNTIQARQTPVEVEELSNSARSVSTGYAFTCAVTNTGSVLCWGNNTYGKLGDGSTQDRSSPVAVAGLPEKALAVSTGEDSSCALTESGKVFCWGKNLAGELGEDGVQSATPVEIGNLDGVAKAVSVGDEHACALLETGEVQCWGANFFGQVGLARSDGQIVPTQVGGLESVQAVTAGAAHTCALSGAGEVLCWGVDIFGQLGDNSLAQTTPSQVMVAVPSASFRPTGPLVPELTTHIPTPLDVSIDPGVVGANLLLAAAAMILLTAASELFNQTLGGKEVTLVRWLPLARKARGWQERIEGRVSGKLKRPALVDAFKLGGLILAYGLTFSFLEPDWKPFTLTGSYLFFCLTFGGGIVGLADEIIQWWAARRWHTPTAMKLYPANLLLAVSTTGFSRLFHVIPGFMFGSPHAIEIETGELDRRQQRKLVLIGAFSIFILGLVLWLLSIGTSLLQRGDLPSLTSILIGGLESLFLSIFALSVQNAFVQMLAFPDSYGRALLRWNRWVWGAVLLAITFIFYHTLVNPRDDLATAWASVNVRVFLITAGAVTLLSLSMWAVFKLRQRTQERPAALPALNRLRRSLAGKRFSRFDATVVSPTPAIEKSPGDAPCPIPEAADLAATSVDSLLFGLKAPDPVVRLEAVGQLAALGPQAVNPLIARLSHPDPWARLMAVAALGKLETDQAAPALQGALSDSDEGVRFMAQVALNNLCETPALSPPVVEIAPSAELPEPAPPPAVQVAEPPAGAYTDGDEVECEHCGKRLKVKIVSKGKIAIVTPEVRRVAALRCQFCGLITCDACATDPSNPMIPICPACKRAGGPYFFQPGTPRPNGQPARAPSVETAAVLAQAVQAVPSLRSSPALPVTRSPRRKLLLGAGLGAICLLAILVGAWYFRNGIPLAGIFPSTPTRTTTPTSSPAPTPRATPTPRPTPTRTPAPSATPIPAWVQSFAKPILAAIADQPPTFESDFSSGAGREVLWHCTEVYNPGCEIVDGVMRVQGTGDPAPNLSGGIHAQDFVLQFDLYPITVEDQSGFVSVNFRHVEDMSIGYNLEFMVKESSWLFRHMSLNDQDFYEESDLYPSIDQGKRLTILLIARGEQIAVYLNDDPLAYFSTCPQTPGDGITFTVRPRDGEALVEFDNVKFWNLANVHRLP